jgi:formylmethanofuran dehydrogenase subunit E
MGEKAVTVVLCEACGERVAEIVADGRTLCSPCHLEETKGKAARDKKPRTRE